MYKINYKNNPAKVIKQINISNIDGYTMRSKNKFFIIGEYKVSNIKIIHNNLIQIIINPIVNRKFNKLIKEITELFLSDDDSDGTIELILDEIEKFRQEIKHKYRMYLNEKELKIMSNKLKLLQKEAKLKKQNLINYNNKNYIGRSK